MITDSLPVSALFNGRYLLHSALFSDCPDESLLIAACFAYAACMGRQVPVRDEWICKALKKLPVKKREIILMLYFLDMTEKEIAACLKLVQSTVHYHKDDSLRLMRKLME